MNHRSIRSQENECLTPDLRWKRDECQDMQLALSYLYDFKKKLDELHPHCLYLIDQILKSKQF